MTDDPAARWDHHAATYQRLFAPLTGFIARGMFKLVEGRAPAGAQVLDIACGAGELSVAAAQHLVRHRAAGGPAGRVVATDFSPAMLAATLANARAAGVDDTVLQGQVEDGQALSFPDASFDLVCSSFGIFLFRDRVAGWREAARVLRPGGTFATAVWQGPATNAMLRNQMGPIGAALPARLARPSPGGWLEIADADALIAEVTRNTPLVDARCVPFHATIVLPDSAQVWSALHQNPVMGQVLAACTPEELAAVEASVRAHFDGLAGGPGRPIPLDSTCNLLVATRAA
jgi:ubiquinone/menaquinone biosynthesis C-methylase UbiE